MQKTLLIVSTFLFLLILQSFTTFDNYSNTIKQINNSQINWKGFKIGGSHEVINLLILFMMINSNSSSAQTTPFQKETYVLIHGAWGGGWQFEEVKNQLTSLGHQVYTPTLAGTAFKFDVTNQSINLTTHINQIYTFIKERKLENIILLGHSYGGMVISGVATKSPESIKQLIYLDAFVPKIGESVEMISGQESWNKFMAPQIKNGYINFPFGKNINPIEKSSPHSVKSFKEIIDFDISTLENIDIFYIHMNEEKYNAFLNWGKMRALQNNWKIIDIKGSHYVMLEQADILTQMLGSLLTPKTEIEIVKLKDAKVIPVAPSFKITEYGQFGNGLTNGTVAEINGRYPERGWGKNLVSDELVYVISGKGYIEMPNEKIALEVGDVAFVPKTQKIAWKGESLKVFIPCIPAWTNEQHELLIE